MHWLTSITVVASVASALPSTEEAQAAWFGDAPAISVLAPNLTTKWFEGSDYVQVVEVFVQNIDETHFLLKNHDLKVIVDSPSLDTVIPGTVKRLAPGQKALVHVGVKNKVSVSAGTKCTGTVSASVDSHRHAASADVSGLCGISDYEDTADSLLAHRTPDWFDKIKYGIFIHWGLYSVPAYGNTGSSEKYAEWYWKWQHDPDDETQTYQYHLKTYGENVNYDDFAANFTGNSFNAKDWVDLFADAGAQYFVPTTKHHDGFALFNFSEAISRRSSVHYGPKRDFIGELFAAAKQHQPHLRRGTYFSLPEWYNPKYKNGATFGGGPPKNPYTGATLDYTGYVDIDDFVADVQQPQMETLENFCGAILEGQTTRLICCPNGSTGPKTRDGRYDPNPTHPLDRKWESSRGMDPHSYGYNHVTPDSEYMTGEDIVTSLIDIVANNGNFLLDIGPRGDGSIAEVMQTNLRDAGAWIRGRSEAIFGTTYWSVTAGAAQFRYTTTEDAFYVHHIGQPPRVLVIPDPVPLLPGDRVTALGGTASGTTVGFMWTGIGSLKLVLPESVMEGDKYIWTFKIEYVR